MTVVSTTMTYHDDDDDNKNTCHISGPTRNDPTVGDEDAKKLDHDYNHSVPCQLTSQTEVYPVFRKHSNWTSPTNNNTTTATTTNPIHTTNMVSSSSSSWTTLPSLLLVQGDWIALQVGDIAPANCTMITPRAAAPAAATTTTTTRTFAAGERITMESLHCTIDSVTTKLPLGRTTLPTLPTIKSCDHFLTLCNHLQIFILNESPISSSLKRTTGTYYCTLPFNGSKQLSNTNFTRQVLTIHVHILILCYL
jgi:hypothetical protein